MAKVWVTQHVPKLDYRDAGSYGEIVMLTGEGMCPFNNSQKNKLIILTLNRLLADYDIKSDYLLPCGSLANIVAAGAIIGKMTRKIKTLTWSKRDNCYSPIVIDLDKEACDA